MIPFVSSEVSRLLKHRADPEAGDFVFLPWFSFKNNKLPLQFFV